ncbi:MAG: DUF1576 domain-containing protein [Candidatus Izemoplasmataceae bacterium]
MLMVKLRRGMLLVIVSVLLMVLGLLLQPLNVFFDGYFAILSSKSVLLSDYITIGGLGPTLFNVGSLMFLSYVIVRMLDMRISGALFAGILTIGGFAFFGKNLLNVSLIFMGVFLYAYLRKIKLQEVIVVFLFATGISPISSVLMFGFDLPYIVGVPLGVLVGISSGYLLVELSSHVRHFHKGYNLYNVGFACGIFALFYCSLFTLFGFESEASYVFSLEAHRLLLVIYTGICVMYFIVGFLFNKWSLSGMKDLMKRTTPTGNDYTSDYAEGVAMINVGLNGLVVLGLVLLLDIQLSGPVVGGLFTIIGFSAYGKHVRNTWPPMVGVMIMVLLFDVELSVGIILAMLFATALAPLAGEHGILVGVLSGMIHLPVMMGLSGIHGGILLYTNGFAAAFTAVIMDTLIVSYKRNGLDFDNEDIINE